MAITEAYKEPLIFKVHRREPELIGPEKPTPHEFKKVSDIDSQDVFNTHFSVIMFYKNDEPMKMKGRDPVEVIRNGIAKALVYYYPLAGRLREEAEGRKLVVECTTEGVLFIEADADVRLEQFGDSPQPPFPCFEELLFDVPGSGGILHSPLLIFRVTRLKCGGFIFAIRVNHTMCDILGLLYFLQAVRDMGSRGAAAPSILPVWERHLLDARDPPRLTSTHHEYDEVVDTQLGTFAIPFDNTQEGSFFFGPTQLSSLRNCIPQKMRSCSNFDLLTACLWRCHTLALNPEPEKEMRVIFAVNTSYKIKPPLPRGYYSSVITCAVAITSAAKLCKSPLGYALQLVQKARKDVSTEDHMRSLADLTVLRGRPALSLVGSYLVSDVTRVRLGEVDYGWGKAVYGGPAKGTKLNNFCIAGRNPKGEEGILVTMCLPKAAMETFMQALSSNLDGQEAQLHQNRIKVLSSL